MRRKGRETYRGPEGAEGKGLRSPTRWRAVQQRVPDGDRGGPWRTGAAQRRPCLPVPVSPPRALSLACAAGSTVLSLAPFGALARCCPVWLSPALLSPPELGQGCVLARRSLALTRDLGLSWDHAPSRFRPAWLSIFLPFLLFISLIQSVRL